MASDYYDKSGKEVYDGDVAYADDLNTVNDAVDTAFQGVQVDIEAVDVKASKAEEWAEDPEDVPVEPGKYSALHWSAKSEGFTADAETSADEAKVSEDNAKVSEDNAKASADKAEQLVDLNPMWTLISTNHTAITGEWLQVDTALGVIEVTLPDSPVALDCVSFNDYGKTFGDNMLLVKQAASGEVIQEVDEDMEVDTMGVSFRLSYINSTKGWVIF